MRSSATWMSLLPESGPIGGVLAWRSALNWGWLGLLRGPKMRTDVRFILRDQERVPRRQKKIPKIHDSASVHALKSLPRPERVFPSVFHVMREEPSPDLSYLPSLCFSSAPRSSKTLLSAVLSASALL